MDHTDVQRLLTEQQPDPAAPCPHCGKPVREDKNVFVEHGVPRLIAHCGGSAFDNTGDGCFEKVAWSPDKGAWEPY
ncbi:hypothetical protein ACFV1W_14190 [Kitasatospora sp. NPDC059648]|uniref:hypothetical protein n=1 Tax=Kitasatospora sp. NPDC059648 TaxID=3346894 RepID=UPI0036CE20F0